MQTLNEINHSENGKCDVALFLFVCVPRNLLSHHRFDFLNDLVCVIVAEFLNKWAGLVYTV